MNNPWREIVEGSDYYLKSQEWEDLLSELDTLYEIYSGKTPESLVAIFNGFDPKNLPPVLISIAAKLYPGSKGMFWEEFINRFPQDIQVLIDSKFELSEDEKLVILKLRKERKEAEERRVKQEACKHKNKVYEGRFGHNGDDWYFCRDCGKKWYE